MSGNTKKQEFAKIDLASLNWDAVFADYKVDKNLLSGNQVPCPARGCGGKTRFRYDNKYGTGNWYCNHCGPGDGIGLISMVKGENPRDILIEIAKKQSSYKGQFKATSPSDSERKSTFLRKLMNKLWSEASPLDGTDPASRYLKARLPGLTKGMIGRSVRYHHSVELPDVDGMREDAVKRGVSVQWPAMLAMVTDTLTGKPIALHRTYLTPEGTKAPFENVKFALGPTKGGWILLGNGHPAAVVGIAEGLESSWAAAIMANGNLPMAATLDSGHMAELRIPDHVNRMLTFGDNDPNGVGFVAQDKLLQRGRKEGKVMIPHYPSQVGWDMNDVLLNAPIVIDPLAADGLSH